MKKVWDAAKSDYFKTTSKVGLLKHSSVTTNPENGKFLPIQSRTSDTKISIIYVCMFFDRVAAIINCTIKAKLTEVIWFSNISAFRWPRSLTETRSVSFAHHRAYTCLETAGGCDRSRWFERARVSNRRNFVPSSVSATQTTTCNSWIWIMGSSIAPPRPFSSLTPISESTLCWA